MGFSTESLLLFASVIIFISIFVSKAGSKFGIPTLLLFLLVGMAFGSDGLGIQFNSMESAQAFGIVALNIILFSGGMDTKYSKIKPIILPGILLATIGVLLTALLNGIFIYLLSGSAVFAVSLSFPTSILLASTMSSTDSASVFNVLRSQKMGLQNNLRPMLELESGSNDPVAYMLTIAMIGIINSGQEVLIWNILQKFIFQICIGSICGFVFGKFAVWVVNKIKLANTSLYPILVLCFVFFIFSMTDMLQGNGYLAVYMSGVIVGNHPLVKKLETNTFLDGLTWLFQIVMFLMLGLLVNPHEMLTLAPFALLVGVFMIVFARPISVFITLLPFRKISVKSKCFISWVGLRGAVPILFATYPVIANVENSNIIFNIVFFITILSLIIQGSTIPRMAKSLGLIEKLEKQGNDFGIVFPEEIDSKIWDINITEEILSRGTTLADMKLPKGILVILIKRDDEYIIPDGTMEIKLNDKLLLVSPPDHSEPHILQS